MTKQSIPNDPVLFTVADLARRLRRSRYGVAMAIRRLQLTPAQTIAGSACYTQSAVETLAAAMRKPNRQP